MGVSWGMVAPLDRDVDSVWASLNSSPGFGEKAEARAAFLRMLDEFEYPVTDGRPGLPSDGGPAWTEADRARLGLDKPSPAVSRTEGTLNDDGVIDENA